jgi:hypothetical protein
MMLRCSRERASEGQAGMVREYLYSLCGGALMGATWSGFGWFVAPEPAEHKLGQLWAGVAQTIPVRTLPPEVPAIRCVMMWVSTAGPEIWCPAAPPLPEDQVPAAVPTS